MAFIEALFALMLIAGVLLLPMILIKKGRREYLESLGGSSKEGLLFMTKGMFDAVPTATQAKGRAALEGQTQGQSIAIRTFFNPKTNWYYVNRGFKTGITADTSVTINLKGATPRFKMTKTKDDWTSDIDDALALDEPAGEAVERWKTLVTTATSIEATPEGLRFEFQSDGGARHAMRPTNPPEQPDLLRATFAAALALQSFLLSRLDRAHVRVDAGYREALPEEEAPEISNQAEG